VSYSFSEIEQEFIDRVHKMVWCNVASLDTHNRPRSRIMHTIWESATYRACTGWAVSRRHALKSKHLAHSPYVSLAYISDLTRPVYADCTAEWEDKPDEKKRIWDLFASAPPPLGFDPALIFKSVDNPDYGLLKFTPWRIELADISSGLNQRKIWRA
jgi:general stress protein 26